MKYRTYGLKSTDGGGFISGFSVGNEAILIDIFLLLLTENGRFNIFDDDYGIKRNDLYGERTEYSASMLKRRIREAIEKRYGGDVSLLNTDFDITEDALKISIHLSSDGTDKL